MGAAAPWSHPTAIVDDGAIIGPGTKVWHFCHIMPGARIGARCSLGQNVFVGAKAIVGDGCKIQNNVSLYDAVELAADVFVGPSAVFTNVLNPRAFIVRKNEYRATRVDRGATIGANATIVCGHNIGPYAFVAAGAVVTHDVPAFALMAGVPARQIGWMCRCGIRLESPATKRVKTKGSNSKVGKAVTLTCQACNTRYSLSSGGGTETLALDEPAPARP
jgi:UDP-2-acetamido-3-amino-2,3-dideoxy-glucuronate N-acetyltransferase